MILPLGMAGSAPAWLDVVRPAQAWQDKDNQQIASGLVGLGGARSGLARQGTAGQGQPKKSLAVWLGKAGLGLVRRGGLRHGTAGQGQPTDRSRLGAAGSAWHGSAGQDKDNQQIAHGPARPGEVWHGLARQGRARTTNRKDSG